MGGLIAMAMAADPSTAGRIHRLVLNDVGPLVPAAALARIGQYVSRDWRFADLAAAESHVRAAYAPFGRLGDAQWRFLTEISVVADAGGGFVPAYDPAIGATYHGQTFSDIDLWPLWDAIQAPVLVLRGAESDVLLEPTATEMTRRGPRAELVTFAAVGHAPALFDDTQIGVVRRWLDSAR
jgi:pimeloyl-ACP methyl ester carboxylesterase